MGRGFAPRRALAGLALGALAAVAPAASAATAAQLEASRLLTQATFGPTLAEINRAASLGTTAWVDEQLDRRPTYHLPRWSVRDVASQPHGELQGVWFEVAVQAPDQLRQRVAFALSEIMVVSAHSDIDPRGLVAYYDLLVRHAFGNFRTLVTAVTKSMAMGRYLSMYQNRRPDAALGIRADENFARELMQLFTIGLVKLAPDGTPLLNAQGRTIPTYVQRDIENLARIFTGWSSGNTPGFWHWPPDWTAPMVPFEEYHDRDAKVFLGRSFPAGQDAAAELSRALAILFQHANVGPFIARQLIQHLVTSNPTPAYVGRVAAVFADNGAGVRGDLRATVRAILLDDEARQGHVTMPETFGKLREPVLRQTHLWRALGATGEGPGGRFPPMYVQDGLSQAPLHAPSVFNFFSPGFAPDGELRTLGLVAPEMQLANDSSINRAANFADWTLYNFVENPYRPAGGNGFVAVRLAPLAALAGEPEAMLNQLNLLLMNGRMTAAMRDAIARRVQDFRTDWDPEHAHYWRAREAVYLLANSPQYQVQR